MLMSPTELLVTVAPSLRRSANHVAEVSVNKQLSNPRAGQDKHYNDWQVMEGGEGKVTVDWRVVNEEKSYNLSRQFLYQT